MTVIVGMVPNDVAVPVCPALRCAAVQATNSVASYVYVFFQRPAKRHPKLLLFLERGQLTCAFHPVIIVCFLGHDFMPASSSDHQFLRTGRCSRTHAPSATVSSGLILA